MLTLTVQDAPYRKPVTTAMKELLEHRTATLRQAAHPLPGSRPYDNFRPINIPARLDGRTLIECVCQMHPQIEREQWLQWFDDGHILCDGHPARKDRSVRGGEQFWHRFPDTVEPDVNAEVQVIWEDASLVAINKPAPLPVHPCGRFNRNTLTWLLDAVYGAGHLRLVHRLDANTTGVLLLARSKSVASNLRRQFELNQIGKRYLVRIAGHPENDTFVCRLPITRGRSVAGSRGIDPQGLNAVTAFRVVDRLGDGTTLVRAIPQTGRTNQIRIHLWAMNLPVLGDPTYLPNRQVAVRQTLTPACGAMCLHAWSLSMEHPDDGRSMEVTADLPAWGLK